MVVSCKGQGHEYFYSFTILPPEKMTPSQKASRRREALVRVWRRKHNRRSIARRVLDPGDVVAGRVIPSRVEVWRLVGPRATRTAMRVEPL